MELRTTATATTTASRIASELALAIALPRDDITVLARLDATSARIQEEVRSLAEKSEQQLGLLILVGRLSRDGASAALEVADGTLTFNTLVEAIGGAENWVTLVDTGVADVVHRDARPPATPPATAPVIPVLGSITIVRRNPRLSEAPLIDLVAEIPAAVEAKRSYRSWVESNGRNYEARGRTDACLDLPVLGNRAHILAARRHLTAANTWGAADAAERAQTAIAMRNAQHAQHPEGFLQRGLALEACDRWVEAIDALRNARNLYDDQSVRQAELLHDPAVGEWRREARYHYGRLQYLHGDNLNDAVASMRAALEHDPDDPRVLLNLGRAIMALIERETRIEAQRYLRRYVELGDPLRVGDEFAAFLGTPATASARVVELARDLTSALTEMPPSQLTEKEQAFLVDLGARLGSLGR